MLMTTKKYSTSRSARFGKLGALSAKVGSSYFGHAVRGALQTAEGKAQSLLKTNTANAVRVARTFGELKGAVMKVGQMLSLQEDLLPPEMREVLRGLQNQAPPVPFANMLPVLRAELGDRLDRFADIAEEAHASASIGQVHRATLDTGEQAVVKIQYPGVEEMVESDLRNIRAFAKSLRWVTPLKADLTKFLTEVRSKLIEELDYRIEARNMQRFGEMFQSDPRFIIPRPVADLCTRRVLTSEYQPGISADELCNPSVPQARRDAVGSNLFDAVWTQFFGHHLLQADPNFANFAFADDERIVMYDFGCVKDFSPEFVSGFRTLARDAVEAKYDRLEADMARLGYVDLGRERLPQSVYREYADAICGGWREPGLYDFGTSTIREQVIRLNQQHWTKVFDYDAPAEAIFLERTLGGMLGNLVKLRARVPMYELLSKHVRDAEVSPVSSEPGKPT
jgi:predicted unusual protein kinase regulating ubiquinone biosynthesis (AarF/ABC1/UbiB family)